MGGRVAGLDQGARDRRRRAVFERSRDAVLLVDHELAILDDNGVLQRWLGLTQLGPDDLLAHVSGDDKAVLAAAALGSRERAAGWGPPVRVRMRDAAGRWRTVWVSASNQLEDPEIGAVILQLSEADEPLRRPDAGDADQLLRQVVEHAPVALVCLDPAGRVLYAAGAALRLEAEQMVGRPLLDFAESRQHVELVRRALTGEEVSGIFRWGGRQWQASMCPVRDGGTLTAVAAVFTDVTTQVLLQTAGTAQAEHLDAVINAAREAIIVLDTQGVVRTANAECARLFGAPIPPGASLADLVGEDTAAALAGRLDRRARDGFERYELRLRNASGEVIWLLVSASPMFGDDGEFVGSVGVLTDISVAKAEQRRLEAVALTDPVTGVASRFTVADRLAHALHRRDAGVVAVLFLDVDRLKATNDEYGHGAGDELLRHVAGHVAAALRPEDSLARYGGDEFVVVCEDLPDVNEALALAERVRAAVAHPLVLGDVELAPSVSVGVATAPPQQALDDLLASADAACYVAKRSGRNAVHLAQ